MSLLDKAKSYVHQQKRPRTALSEKEELLQALIRGEVTETQVAYAYGWTGGGKNTAAITRLLRDVREEHVGPLTGRMAYRSGARASVPDITNGVRLHNDGLAEGGRGRERGKRVEITCAVCRKGRRVAKSLSASTKTCGRPACKSLLHSWVMRERHRRDPMLAYKMLKGRRERVADRRIEVVSSPAVSPVPNVWPPIEARA